MEELNKEQEAPKKKRTVKKKEPKLTVKEELIKTAKLIKKTVKDERGKSLNTSSCARLNKIEMDLQAIIRTL